MRRIVSDTGPLLHLAEAQALHLLPLVGEISVPRSVYDEVARLLPDWQSPAWLTIADLVEPWARDAIAWQQSGLLHAGEAAAIALVRQLTADWLLTDDAAARLFGQTLGLEVHGSLGIVLWAARAGYLDRAQAGAILEGLLDSSLWLSASVFAEARQALDRLFYRGE